MDTKQLSNEDLLELSEEIADEIEGLENDWDTIQTNVLVYLKKKFKRE
jgi:hypothetical protein